jgi:hypothetical protein
VHATGLQRGIPIIGREHFVSSRLKHLADGVQDGGAVVDDEDDPRVESHGVLLNEVQKMSNPNARSQGNILQGFC